MDLRNYFGRIRELEQSLSDEYVLVVSRATPDGGKPGIVTEVTRYEAAKLVVEQRADLATKEKAASYRQAEAERRQEIEAAALASRVQVTVISEPKKEKK